MFSQRTTTALLQGLHDPGNRAAWEELDARCRPIMVAVARRLGLSGAEAEDATQAAMMAFLESYREGRYDRARGRLSAFIVSILRARAIDICRRAHRRHEVGNAVSRAEQMTEAEVETIWAHERQNRILASALEELREGGADERHLRAFELYGLRGVSVEEVGRQVGMSREEIYNAKYRITKRLQPIVARLDELYEDL